MNVSLFKSFKKMLLNMCITRFTVKSEIIALDIENELNGSRNMSCMSCALS